MWIDVAVLAIVALFTAFGAKRGLFSQAWSLASLVVAFIIAGPVFQQVALRLGSSRDDSILGEMVLKLITGVVLYILLLGVGYLIERIVVNRFTIVVATNRIMGGLLGMVKGAGGAIVALWILLFAVPAAVGVQDLAQNGRERVQILMPAQAQGSDSGRSGGPQTDREAGKTGAARPVSTASPPSSLNALEREILTSRVAAVVSPYNPLNLFFLARIKPYLPSSARGNAAPAVSIPQALKKHPTYQQLVASHSFLQAYGDRQYLAIIRDPAFHRYVQDETFLSMLENLQ